ncbi:MAG TPA: tetratricopeptide repeat protein [Humisphaera sp.]|nr:tetratricopeptide repeat protein [Humisphaera sp.]
MKAVRSQEPGARISTPQAAGKGSASSRPKIGRVPTLFIFHFSFFILSLSGCQPANQTVHLTSDAARDAAAARERTDKAFDLIQRGRFAEAQPLLLEATHLDANYGPAHNNLGLVYYHDTRLYEAAWEFQTAIKLMPRQPQPHNNLGLVMESAGKLDEAEKSFVTANALEPDNPEYAGNLARLRVRQGKHDEETRKLLELLVMKDRRPDWVDWAKFNLSRWPQGEH